MNGMHLYDLVKCIFVKQSKCLRDSSEVWNCGGFGSNPSSILQYLAFKLIFIACIQMPHTKPVMTIRKNPQESRN